MVTEAKRRLALAGQQGEILADRLHNMERFAIIDLREDKGTYNKIKMTKFINQESAYPGCCEAGMPDWSITN